jgi:hypothetical protein
VHGTIAPLVKKHLEPGSTIFTDMHTLYVNMPTNESRLTPYGFYHMWTNHSQEMIHHKLPFIHTMTIERHWLSFKREN